MRPFKIQTLPAQCTHPKQSHGPQWHGRQKSSPRSPLRQVTVSSGNQPRSDRSSPGAGMAPPLRKTREASAPLTPRRARRSLQGAHDHRRRGASASKTPGLRYSKVMTSSSLVTCEPSAEGNEHLASADLTPTPYQIRWGAGCVESICKTPCNCSLEQIAPNLYDYLEYHSLGSDLLFYPFSL